jgi:hypothetical protein
MTAALLLALLFVLLPLMAVRYGVDSRPGFATRPDWRRRDS